MNKTNILVLMLGGNVGDTKAVFSKAARLLEKHIGSIQKTSRLYVTEPWGNVVQQNYYNQAIILKTSCSTHMVLSHILFIENQLGRVREQINGPRLIDIDILFYNNLIINDLDLVIPHPRLHLRKFNLVPVVEIAPDYIHPLFNKTVSHLLSICNDNLKVHPLI